MASPLWALVPSERGIHHTAGRAGGERRPSWSPGGPSKLQETISRVSGLVPGSQTVAVVCQADRSVLSAMQGTAGPAHTILESADRGTAPSVLLGLATILDIQPNAHVLVTPATHRLRDLDQFRFSVRQTAGWIRAGHADIVLFGARPTNGPSTSSWLTPGPSGRRQGPRPLRPIVSFVDHAERDDVAELTRSGSVCNTNVLVARAETLFDLYRQHLPALVDLVMRARQFTGDQRDALLAGEYQTMRPADFSRDILSHAEGMAVYIWPSSIGWAPQSAADRLETWQQQSGGRRRLAPVLGWAPVSVRRALGA